MKQVSKTRRAVVRIAVTGVMTGLVMAFTYFGVNLGTAYVNLGDAMVLAAGALFGPVTGMIAGGLGAMLMDLIVYPATFVFTLFIKGIEGALCGVLLKYALPKLSRGKYPLLQVVLGITAMMLCALFMAAGYFGTNVLFWGEGDSPATRLSGALLQLPIDIAQGAVGCAIAALLIYAVRLDKIAARFSLCDLLIVNDKGKERTAQGEPLSSPAEKGEQGRENAAGNEEQGRENAAESNDEERESADDEKQGTPLEKSDKNRYN